MSHPNAVLTPRGRLRLVELVEDQGLTFRQAAACLNVSVSTVWEWVTRWRGASPGEREGLVCLRDRSSRPHRQPRRFDALAQAQIVLARRRTGWGPRLIAGELEMAHQSVWKVLERCGVSRQPRAAREHAHRYEWPCPGDLLHMDTKRYARFTRPGHAVTGVRTKTSAQRRARVGYQFAHAIVDDHTRLAYVELHDDERADTVTAFTQRAIGWFSRHGIQVHRVMPRQCLELYPQPVTGRVACSIGCAPSDHAPLSTPYEWKSRALSPDHGARVGIRDDLLHRY
jgi:transposase